MAIGQTQSDMSADRRAGAQKKRGLAEIIYDPKVRGIFFQAALLIGVASFFAWIVSNAITNLADLDKRSGFAFLTETSGFEILTTPGTWAVGFGQGSTYLDIFIVGVINTMAVAVLGIVAATVIGFVLGVFRLSSNVVLRGFATAYVELLRNLPLLLQLFICYKVVIEFLPARRDEPFQLFGFLTIDNTALIDISGLYLSYPVPQTGFAITLAAVFVAIIGWVALSAWARKRQDSTGQRFPAFWVGLGLLIFLPLLVFVISGGPLEWEDPVRGRFGFRQGVGMVMKPEFFALWLGLTLYTASFIAEIVRAGILAVSKGQTEAAFALGLKPQSTLSLIVIPQALRVIIPPLTSQFLNLTKNSSLAVAIGFPDVVAVFAGTALNQVGQEIEMVFMMMMVYLVLSGLISLFMNWYNRSIALVER